MGCSLRLMRPLNLGVKLKLNPLSVRRGPNEHTLLALCAARKVNFRMESNIFQRLNPAQKSALLGAKMASLIIAFTHKIKNIQSKIEI
jgi:hypothetical protein